MRLAYLIPILSLLIVILISGCAQQSQITSTTIQQTTTSVVTYDLGCPVEELKNYLKTALERYHKWYPNEIGFHFSNDDTILDWQVCVTAIPTCHNGNQVGENVNYIYCKGCCLLDVSDAVVCIKKTITKPDGTIEKIIRKCVDKIVFDSDLNIVSINCINMPQDGEYLCK
jgi:hypothetical protein